MSTYVEPAVKSYFFGKGYRDLKAVVAASWQQNIDSASDFFSRIGTSGEWWENVFAYVFWGGAGLSVILFGTTFFVAVSVLHIIFLVLLLFFIYVGFTIIWAIERTFLFLRHFFAACPHCHKKSVLPEYLCDACGKIHAKLVPNDYGILYHKCECGQKLPATFFVNRGRLQARCPDCHQFLQREHIESKRIFIPILGGPSAGKTAFLFSVVRKFMEESVAELGFSAEFIDPNTKAEYEKVINQLKKGKVPGKTTASIPKAFNLALKKDNKIKWLLYIYDPAGEAYRDTENLSGHRFHGYSSGMVMIVDPFSIPAVRRNYAQDLSKTWSDVNPSQLDIESALSRVLLTMEESFALSKTDKIKEPFAVVMSKVDAFDLEEVVGEAAVERAMAVADTTDRTKVRNEVLRKQLLEWGEEAFVHQLDTRFTNVRYFSCSALGRIPDASERDLVPYDVFAPILWLCRSVSSKDFSCKK